MEFTFLGTCAGVPSKGRNVSAMALRILTERGMTWLFDCGEATQHQILHTNITLSKIEKIFITHLHGDHIFGLPGLLGSRSFQGATTPLVVYGPKGIKEYIEVSLKISNTYLRYPIDYVELEEDGIIFEDEQFRIETKKVVHGLPSYGYRIVEKEIPGTLLVEKLKEKGVMPGPIYQRIKNGENIVLVDGTILEAKGYTSDPVKGRIVTIIGDTRFCEASIDLANEADILIHEATFNKENEAGAHEFYHSTSTQAATVALKSNAKMLIMNHLSSRFQGEDMEILLQEARSLFANTYLAHDFDQFQLARKKRNR
ncbi:MAG: ribonuclease Z [Bacillaceae bacterium]